MYSTDDSNPIKSGKPAIFLDRDGTIIKDKGYVNCIKRIEFYPFTFESLRKLQQKFQLFIVTNQQGVATGHIKPDELNRVHDFLLHKLRDQGIEIQPIYTCTHLKSDNCACRKPKTYFIDKAIESFAIDIRNSYVLGDHPSDVELAINAGAKGIYLLTGHGRKHLNDMDKDLSSKIKVAASLKTATNFLI